MSDGPVIWWLGNDLRLTDQAALDLPEVQAGGVVPAFVWAPEEDGGWAPGAASRWWLKQSLQAFDQSLQSRGARLVCRRGPSAGALLELARQTGARLVVRTRRSEPAARERDASVVRELSRSGLTVREVLGSVLFEPDAIATAQGRPYVVFGAFWRRCLDAAQPGQPLPAPARLAGPTALPGPTLDEVLPSSDAGWTAKLREAWTPGEQAGLAALQRLRRTVLSDYDEERNYPGADGTSELSPHLHFGEISPRQVWAAAGADGYDPFLRQLGWREFAHHLVWHFPQTVDQPLREKYASFPWRDDPAALRAWQRGETGYPLVDAGLRQLWQTGWMHNRVRMIVASFLVKDLLLPWTTGAAWFWDTLVDADLANNTLGWQWTAGCGADAAPYFRIFNPVAQGREYDPEGVYVRSWVPELAGLPDQWVHEPWRAPGNVRRAAGVRLGHDYPGPLVDHAAARQRALAALRSVSG